MDCPRPRTALLVDDSSIVRERLLQLIEGIPNLVVIGQCEEAEGAIASMIRMLPDVLLLDIRLRGGGGMKVLKHAVQHFPTIRIVVLTNQAEDQTRKICLSQGAHHFVDKSKDLNQLSRLLSDYAHQSFRI